MKLTEELSQLLFTLSSADRLALLSDINAKKQRLATLSKVIDASTQECSTHLIRLSDFGFIKKDAQGFYETTSLGKLILNLFPSIEFLPRYKDYFLSHDLSFLPKGYVERIGELSGVEYVNHLSLVLKLIKTVISTGREYVLLISDQPIIVGGSIGASFHSRELPVRLIGEQTIDRKIIAETKLALPNSEVRTLQEVRIAMAINEAMAGVCFAGINGKIDFSAGFSGKDQELRSWCCDLFEYFWSKSRRVVPL
jgi:predicted transcriptional regulator